MVHYTEYMKSERFLPILVAMKKKTLCDNIFCFDIETCNFFVSPEDDVLSINDIFRISGNNPDRAQALFERCEAGGVCFIWQVCLDGRTLYGRNLCEFKDFCDYISERVEGAKIHCWVHNLAFEYQWLQEYLHFDKSKILFTEARKPLYCEYKNIVFRCSYRLTNLSLAKWGENSGVAKRVGQLDYFGLYTPLTDLDEQQLDYCEIDVVIQWTGIRSYLKQYGHIANIPWTQTGIPRGDVKRIKQQTYGSQYFVAKCQPKTAEEWKVQHCTFSGGLTLSNPAHTGVLLHDLESYDKKSAYPFAFFKNYPVTGFEKVNSSAEPNWFDGYHHICLVEFKNLRAKYNITPLSSSKRIMMSGAILAPNNADELEKMKKGKDITKNNGKIIFCKRFAAYYTEVDMWLIKEFYDADEIIIHDHYIAASGYMPKWIIDYMLQKYADKTLLKNGDPDLYMIAKQIINSLFGMSACAIIRDMIVEDDEYQYHKTRPTDEQTQLQLFKLQDQPYRNILPYSYSIYITAHQRYMLMHTALTVAGIDDCCYFDTDSIKGQFDDKTAARFAAENKRIIEWTKERCADQGIEYELSCPKTTDGIPQYLGTWEHDAHYYEFKCLGAKRYAYKESKKDRVHITIAGVPKAAANVLHNVDDLKEGLTFDIFNSRKNLLTYRDGDNPQVTFPDGYKVTNVCAINIRPTSYKLTLSDDYRELINNYLNNKYH